MLTHKRIRERQVECRAAYATGSMTIAAYVDAMTKLNAELKQVEEKMYDATGHLDQIDLLRFITGTIPAAFKKIHARFPHLTFDEVIAFEQTIREAGGSIMTHSGMFVPTKRSTYSDPSSCRYDFDTYVSWTCCHSISYDCGNRMHTLINTVNLDVKHGVYSGRVVNLESNKIEYHMEGSTATPLPSRDLKNRDPLGRCDNPSLFSPIDETNGCDAVASPSQKDGESIVEIESATQAQIDKIEGEISDLRRKAGHLDDLLKTLRTLSSDR